MKITVINAHEVLASGGFPSIEAVVTLEDGVQSRASVPYGASAGSHEATVKTDEDEARYLGKGMQQAVLSVVDEIAPKLMGMSAYDQRAVDGAMLELDGTENKARLGGNAILAVSLAVARAAAHSRNKPLYRHIAETFDLEPDYATLPQPMVVVIEGGKHAHETTDFQEYCLSPQPGGSPRENIRKILETYHQLKQVLKENELSTNVGNEGAFAPSGIPSNEAPFSYMLEAISRAGYTPGEDIGFSLDPAASEVYENGQYRLALEDKSLSSEELIAYFEAWFEKYPIHTIEDPLHEDDWGAWSKMLPIAKEHGIPLIGDDLTVTNKQRLQKAIELGAIDAILIKLNQIGSLTETVETCVLAQEHNFMIVPSHRGGGETNDTAMVDLAVAVNGAYIKVGPTRGERVSKYNRLMAIERELVGAGEV